MKNNQKGFGAIEALLFLILLSILGFTGYYVWHSRNNANSTYSKTANGSNSASSNAYAGWKSYSDDFVSFSYPGTWAAARSDNTSLPNTMQLELKGPDDKDVAKSTNIDSGHKASLVLTIFKNTASGQNNCACKVYGVMDLNMSQLPSAKLVVASADPNEPAGDPSKPAQEMVVSTDSTAKAGNESLNEDVSVGSKTYNIWVAVADNDATGGRISNVSLLEDSTSVKDVIKILNSLNLK